MVLTTIKLIKIFSVIFILNIMKSDWWGYWGGIIIAALIMTSIIIGCETIIYYKWRRKKVN